MLTELHLFIDVEALNDINQSLALRVIGHNLLLVQVQNCELIEIRSVHVLLKPSNEVQVNINGVFNSLDPELQALLVLLGLLVAELLHVIADGVDHGSE